MVVIFELSSLLLCCNYIVPESQSLGCHLWRAENPECMGVINPLDVPPVTKKQLIMHVILYRVLVFIENTYNLHRESF